jgi:NADH:ubiquinone oxidoreductase subunit K
MKLLITFALGIFGVAVNIPVILATVEWVLLLAAATAILVADRHSLGKSSGNNLVFSWLDTRMWITASCLLIIIGLTATYTLGKL